MSLCSLGGSDSNASNRVSNPEKRSPTKQLNKLILNPLTQRQHTRQHSISAVYDTSIGSQEQIVEKAKQVSACCVPFVSYLT